MQWRVTTGCFAEGLRDASDVSEDTCKELIKHRIVAKKFYAGVKIVATHCRLLCYDLDSGAKFFDDDLASCRNSLISGVVTDLSLTVAVVKLLFATYISHLAQPSKVCSDRPHLSVYVCLYVCPLLHADTAACTLM